jgi:uncharacterized damage-inducible protein DinB
MNSFLQFFQYNRDANQSYIKVLQEADGIQDRAFELMSHILNAHEVWLERITPGTTSGQVNPWDKRDLITLNDVNFDLYGKTEKLLKSSSSEILSGKKISYKTTKGQPFESKIADILYHIVNHASYHRGQISIFLREKEITPPNSDYIFYVRDL